MKRWNGMHFEEVATAANDLPALRQETVYTISDLAAVGRSVVAAGSLWPKSAGGTSSCMTAADQVPSVRIARFETQGRFLTVAAP